LAAAGLKKNEEQFNNIVDEYCTIINLSGKKRNI